MPAMSWRRLALSLVSVILLSGCAGTSASNGPTPTAPFVAPTPAASASVPELSVEPSSSPSPAGSNVPSPTQTTFKFVKEAAASNGASTEQYRATWSEPNGAATKFLVYGVTDCLRSAQTNDNTPCVTETTPIPAAELKLISTVPGTGRSLDVSWTLEGEAGPGPYQAVVIVAENGTARSSPTVLWSALVCYGCVI